jgi:hypothetical protein
MGSVLAADGPDRESRPYFEQLAANAIGHAPETFGTQHQPFVLLHMPKGSDVKKGTTQLIGILGDIKRPSGVTLALGSPDTSGMAAMVVGAFSRVRNRALAGCKVIFIGAAADRARTQEAIEHAGATYVFAEYAPAA